MTENEFRIRLKNKFLDSIPDVRFISIRFLREFSEVVAVRQNVVMPVETGEDQGIMVTVDNGSGVGYGATCDISETGIKNAISEALKWAEINGRYPLIDYGAVEMPHSKGNFRSKVVSEWNSVSLNDKIDILKGFCESLKKSDLIVDWHTMLWHVKKDSYYITSRGGEVFQTFSYVIPDMGVTANRGSETQKRNIEGMMALGKQGGFEIFDIELFKEAGERIVREALELLDAPDCPTGEMDLLLDPSQMILQIHESIGHPLEIDRILGDERNYAGTSFVIPEMFGKYRYGSDLLNITFDPTIEKQFLSYAFDDDGSSAKKEFLIEKGILKRGLGGNISQFRSGIPGVACSRASGWNRPPIDRMANLNLEQGTSSLADMIGSVEKGVYMNANTSWSIDDSRNKFQFGCEWGRLIENGKLTKVVKKPNYRGISSNFWRSLRMVGDESTFKVMGISGCGKGEPNQSVFVGHATPAALFGNVDIFGGD